MTAMWKGFTTWVPVVGLGAGALGLIYIALQDRPAPSLNVRWSRGGADPVPPLFLYAFCDAGQSAGSAEAWRTRAVLVTQDELSSGSVRVRIDRDQGVEIPLSALRVANDRDTQKMSTLEEIWRRDIEPGRRFTARLERNADGTLGLHVTRNGIISRFDYEVVDGSPRATRQSGTTYQTVVAMDPRPMWALIPGAAVVVFGVMLGVRGVVGVFRLMGRRRSALQRGTMV